MNSQESSRQQVNNLKPTNEDVLPSFNNKIYSPKSSDMTKNQIILPTRVHKISTVTPTKIITHYSKNGYGADIESDTDSEDDNDNENENKTNQGSSVASIASIRNKNGIVQNVITTIDSDSDDTTNSSDSSSDGDIDDDEKNINSYLEQQKETYIEKNKYCRQNFDYSNILNCCQLSVNDKTKVDLLFQKIVENMSERKTDIILNNLSMTVKVNEHFILNKLRWIKKIVITNNNIPQINFSIFPGSLTHLILTNNNIKEFNTRNKFNNLEYLNLSHNDLSTFYNVTNETFPVLQRLNLSHNKIVGSLTNSLKIQTLNTLISLNVSHNKLECIEYICKNNKIEVLQCEHNNLKKVSIMSDSLITIYLSHNPELRKLTLNTCRISTINMYGGEFSKLESASFNMLINKVCRIEIDEKYNSLLENANISKFDSGEINNASKFAPISTKFWPGNKFEANKSGYGGQISDKPNSTSRYYDSVVNSYKPYNPNHNPRDHSAYNHGANHYNNRGAYWQNHSQHGVWKNGVRVIENPTQEQINFYISKTIENYARAIKNKCTTDMTQLLDETFVFPQDNTYVI